MKKLILMMTVMLSTIISATAHNAGNNDYMLSANPDKGILYITSPVNTSVVITDNHDNIIFKLKTQSGKETIKTGNLSQGYYYLQMVNAADTVTRKLLVL